MQGAWDRPLAALNFFVSLVALYVHFPFVALNFHFLWTTSQNFVVFSYQNLNRHPDTRHLTRIGKVVRNVSPLLSRMRG